MNERAQTSLMLVLVGISVLILGVVTWYVTSRPPTLSTLPPAVDEHPDVVPSASPDAFVPRARPTDARSESSDMVTGRDDEGDVSERASAGEAPADERAGAPAHAPGVGGAPNEAFTWPSDHPTDDGELLEKLARAEALWTELDKKPLGETEAEIQDNLQDIANEVRGLGEVLMEVVVEAEDPVVSVHAMALLGDVYWGIARKFDAVSPPAHLTPEEAAVYKELLVEFGRHFEDQARGYYATAAGKGTELGLDTPAMVRAAERLAE